MTTALDHRPALVGISHGTSSVDGHNAIASLMDAVESRHPEIEVRSGFVDVERPNVPEALGLVRGDAGIVVVPLLLSAGYHVHVDLAREVRAGDAQVTLAGALGPDIRLARILHNRLREAGSQPGDHVIMTAAGSSDARAIEDCGIVADQLATELGDDVTLAFHSAHSPTLPEAIADARVRFPERRVVISSYLLAPGYFQSLAENSDADIVTEPILSPTFGPADALVELVGDRYRAELPGHRYASGLSTPTHNRA